MPVRIVTDSTCDLPAATARSLGVTVVPLNVFFGEQRFRDGVDIDARSFYDRLVVSSDLPRTSQPSAEAFKQAYHSLSFETTEIVSLHISSRLSGTLNSASVARDQLQKDGLHIELMDSYTASLGLGLVVREAARAAGEGASLQDVIAVARHAMDRVNVYVLVDTLEYLKRGGRIGRASSLLGSVLSIKPIIGIVGGEVVPFDRVRTRSKAIERLYELATDDGAARALYVASTGNEAEAAAFASRLRPVLSHTDVHTADIGPTVGVYTGPNALGVAILHGD